MLALQAKGAGGFGMYLPSIVVVALGEPGVPVVWNWAWAEGATAIKAIAHNPLRRMLFGGFIGVVPYWILEPGRHSAGRFFKKRGKCPKAFSLDGSQYAGKLFRGASSPLFLVAGFGRSSP